MSGVNIKGLKHFISKVEKYKGLSASVDEMADKIADRGIEIAQQHYYDKSFEIKKEVVDKGHRKIIVKGEGLAYLEFGTGLVGKGTYPDESKLPQQTITFESPKGKPQSTQGWEYYYPNKDTKVNGGWFAGKTFHRGQVAGAQMYDTSKQLKAEMGEIGKKHIKGVIK